MGAQKHLQIYVLQAEITQKYSQMGLLSLNLFQASQSTQITYFAPKQAKNRYTPFLSLSQQS